jgi:imidazolonepropionase-like amidohydrolase
MAALRDAQARGADRVDAAVGASGNPRRSGIFGAMRILALSAIALVWAACSEPARTPAASGTASGAAQPPPAAAAAGEVKRIVIVNTRKSGTSTVSTSADGTIRTSLFVLQNGRGPRVDATLRLAPDGTIASLSATGQHEMGTKVAETFTLGDGRARWKSEEEQGERAVTGPAFFVPMATMPEIYGFLVPAAIAHGGTIALLPAGEARVEKVAEMAVSAGGQTRNLLGYAITGLELQTQYTWMNEDGTWFGSVSPYSSLVPEGWEGSVGPLVDKQKELDRTRDAALAKAQAHRPPAAGVLLTHARVLDVRRGKWLADHAVLVVGDKIAAVGPSARVKAPEGAEVIDLAGQAVIPGLVDMHMHLGGVDGVLAIASGVTTGRDVGNEPDMLDDFKNRFDEGAAIGPHLLRFGFIEGRNEKAASSKITAETVEEAKAAVEFYAARKYEGVKIYNSVKTELVPVIAKEAHARGMLVTGHIPVHMLANEAVLAGYDGIEHINMLFLNFFATKETDTRDTTRFTLMGEHAAGFDLAGKPARDFFALLRRKKTVVTPTVDAFEDLLVGESGKVIPGLEAVVDRLPVQTRRYFLRGGLPVPPDKRPTYRASFDKVLAMVKALVDARIQVMIGTDHIAGLMVHHEMELFARAGVPNAKILQMTSIDAARAMRLDKQVGTITRGQRADLAIIDGDPLADMTTIRRVTRTMRAGVLYQSAPLYEAVGVLPLQPGAGQ